MNNHIAILISTSNNRINLNLNCFYESRFSYVIVHQLYGGEQRDELESLINSDIMYKKLDYPGLSKSRNIALDICNAKYAYIMDDDVEFDLNKISELVQRMETDSVDIATCQFKFQNGDFPKKYSESPFEHDKLSSAKVSSIEICVNIDSLRRSGVRFDERFGLGTDYPSGEEYIFLTDCLKAGLRVRYYPILTGIHPNETSGQDFYTSTPKAVAKREMFKRIFGKKSWLYIIAFWVKKLPYAIKASCGLQFSYAILFGTKNKL